MASPSYDPETLAAYFQAVAPGLLADPRVGPLLRRLASEDPDVVAAVADVDRSQIRAALDRSPADRLTDCSRLAAAYEDMRVVGR